MKKFPGKSVYSIHKKIANSQFDELKYEGKDEYAMRKTFVNQYFENRTKDEQK